MVSLVRVGKMVKATKDSYKRVYKDDGSYHYPKIAVNKLRSKGDEYFQSCEITGSAEGNDKSPKMSLISAYRDVIIPDLERMVEGVSDGEKKVIVVKQEDGAGPHQDKKNCHL